MRKTLLLEWSLIGALMHMVYHSERQRDETEVRIKAFCDSLFEDKHAAGAQLISCSAILLTSK